jgi:four helix bundle protein
MSQPRGAVDATMFLADKYGRFYRDLIAWRKAMELVTEIYRATGAFPREERYGLTNQLRRASVSVPSNIAEGQAHFSQKEFEIETQLMIAENLGYLSVQEARPLLERAAELGKVLNGLIASISTAA